MTILIGLTGYARSGKSTVARILRERDDFAEASFAAPIREMACAILGVNLARLDEIKSEPQAVLGGKTPRYLMQTLGTEWGREMIDPDLWVKACMARVAGSRRYGNPVVISDVRFPNEAEAIRKARGVIWRVVRPGTGATEHSSETSMDAIAADDTIANIGTVQLLTEGVLAALERLVAERTRR